MRKKKALITGFTGQDDFYLTKYLLDKNLNTKAENFGYSKIKGFANIRDFLSAGIIIKKILKILYLTNKPKIINICSRRPTRIIDLAVKIFKNKTCDVNLLLKNNDICKKEYNSAVGKRFITI
jgi:GDP-D-mannose dehydratase